MRNRLFRSLAVLLPLLLLWAFYQAAAYSSRGGEESPLYSSERHDPYGTAALRELLEHRGTPVSTLERPYPDDITGATLIQVLKYGRSRYFGAVPQLQTQRIMEWLERGNTLVVFTRDHSRQFHDETPDDLLERCGLTVEPPDASALDLLTKAESEGAAPGDLPTIPERIVLTFANAGAPRSLMLSLPATLRASAGPWLPLATDGPKWIAAARPVGSGRLVVIATPTPALNGYIAQAGNLDFILAQIGSGPVIFDEWSHGLGHTETMMTFVRRVGLLPVLLQILFAVALFIWSAGGDRGAPDAPPARRRSIAEQIETLGYLYRHTLTPAITYQRVHEEVRRRIAAVLGCPPGLIETHLPRAEPVVAGRAQMLLDHLNNIGRGAGPGCPHCGYDLTLNTTGICPECGRPIPLGIKDAIVASAPVAAAPQRRSSRKPDAALAAVLTESHAFTQEFSRVRRRHK